GKTECGQRGKPNP
ncbi:phage tail fiber, partial [Escherichia coli 5905]